MSLVYTLLEVSVSPLFYPQSFFILMISGEVDWAKGKVSGAVYWGDERLTDLLVKV